MFTILQKLKQVDGDYIHRLRNLLYKSVQEILVPGTHIKLKGSL